jgi:hypothetical protein
MSRHVVWWVLIDVSEKFTHHGDEILVNIYQNTRSIIQETTILIYTTYIVKHVLAA